MEIQDIIQGLTQAEITAITSPDERSLIVNTTLNQAVIYVNGTFKQASFVNTDDIPEGTNKFSTSADLAQITTNANNITSLQTGKEDAFTKNTAFNKDFGTSAGEVLEGDTAIIPEAPSDGKQYARKDAAWEEVAASGTASPLPIIALTSTDNSSTFTEVSPLIVPWDVESEKDTGFTHSNSTNNSRIVVSDDSTYQFGGALRVFNAGDQRVQPLPKLRIDGVIQDMAVDSGYIRGSGSASDYWSLEFTFRPLKLTSGQYVEIQIGLESSNPGTFDGTLIGDESNFWGVKLQGATGAAGATGAGSNIVIQEDDSTIGTVTSTLNFEGATSVVDEGGNKTTVSIPEGLNRLETVTLSGGNIITPSTLNSDQDDYNPTGFSDCNMIRQQINGDRTITGFEAPSAGVNRVFSIANLSGSSDIKFKNNDSGSTAANRILLRDNGPDKSLKENETGIFWYDHTSSRWRPYNRIG
jgi:hypothetical protein